MPNPAKRMTANPAKPVARYRPGKPVAEQESSDEDEESEEEQQQRPQQKTQSRPQPKRPQAAAQAESEDEDEEGFVTEDEDEDEAPGRQAPQAQATATSSVLRSAPPKKEGIESESEEEEEEEDSEDEESSEEESSSEEEAPKRKFQRPTFIKKTDRKPPATQTSVEPVNSTDQDETAQDPDIELQARRLAQADLMIKDKLERDALARAQGKKAWDDDDDLLPESMVDDTDGVDPEAEYAAWKVRELKRLKRDREALVEREKEIEELERRRNLTAEEREKEDKAYLDKQREERDANRSDTGFLARYHHKGAFFQGDEEAEILKRRDVMGARFEDQVSDKSTLPEYMRLRDMTKLGRKGRTRYTDLKGQDTGRFGEEVKRWRGSGSNTTTTGGPGGEFDTRGLDERFLPDNDQRGGRRDTGPTGANASAVAPRRDRDGHRDGERERTREREGDRRKRSYSYSRSRSRSPQRRKREYEHDRDSRRDDDRDRDRDRDRGVKAY